MAPSRRLAALAAIAALAVSACSSNDAKRSDVVSAMEDTGLTNAEAECVGNHFAGGEDDDGNQIPAEFNQDELNDLGSADNPDDFPAGTESTVSSIIEQCTTGSDTGDEGTETTTTTTAEGN